MGERVNAFWSASPLMPDGYLDDEPELLLALKRLHDSGLALCEEEKALRWREIEHEDDRWENVEER